MLSTYLSDFTLSLVVGALVVGIHIVRKIAKRTRDAHRTHFKLDSVIIRSVLSRSHWRLYSGVGLITAAALFLGLLYFR